MSYEHSQLSNIWNKILTDLNLGQSENVHIIASCSVADKKEGFVVWIKPLKRCAPYIPTGVPSLAVSCRGELIV